MEDYPRTLADLENRFATEEACLAYLAALRWPNGFRCPRCQCGEGWATQRGLCVCTTCGYHASLKAGTIFERSRKPLTMWFRAMWWITSQKTGSSALGLQRILGLGSYETAWTWLHKLRRAMVRPGRDRLKGKVEVDETYVGGTNTGKRGRPGKDGRKVLVAIAVEEDGPGSGRVRMRRVADASVKSLQGFVQEAVAPRSVVHTDAWRAYEGLDQLGYSHRVTLLKDDMEALPRVHRVASLLKRWLLGTHQGAVSHKHLDYYLDEYTFRFNRRKSRSRGKLFYRLVQQAVAVGPAPYPSLVRGSHGDSVQTQHLGDT
jgi:transposase-like protein